MVAKIVQVQMCLYKLHVSAASVSYKCKIEA